MNAKRLPAGRLLLSLVAAATAVSPYLADWNETHIYNPSWPPHAKFHNAHTMLLASALGVLSLGYLWVPPTTRARLRTAAMLTGAFWATQAGSILFPGTAFADPEFAELLPTVAGVRLNQVHLDAAFLGLVLAGYALDARRLQTPRPD